MSLTRAVNDLNDACRPTRRAPTRHFVIEECKVAYVCNPGASSTALRWLLAAIGGLRPEAFARSTGVAATRRETVQDNRRWGSIIRPRSGAVPEFARLAEADDWFVFTVVRDPRERVWAAWQAKLLRGGPRMLANEDLRRWIPNPPREPADVIGPFADFVHALATGTAGAIARDPYCRPQTETITRPGLSYTQVYDRSQIARLLADLTTHLERLGRARKLAYQPGPRLPFVLTRAVLTDQVAGDIECAYAADFAALGQAWPDEPLLADGDWDRAGYGAVNFVRAANERIADLSGLLRPASSTDPEGAERV